MVKYINNTSGKSDRHQLHELLYAATHVDPKITRWFQRLEQVKPVGRPRKAKVEKVRVRRVGQDPNKVEAKRQRDLDRAIQYNETKRMMVDDVNINTYVT